MPLFAAFFEGVQIRPSSCPSVARGSPGGGTGGRMKQPVRVTVFEISTADLYRRAGLSPAPKAVDPIDSEDLIERVSKWNRLLGPDPLGEEPES